MTKASKVFFYLSPIPLIMFLFGLVYASRSLDQRRASAVLIASVFISSIGLLAGLRLVANVRKQEQGIRGVGAATFLMSVPLAVMYHLLIRTLVLGFFSG